MSPEATLPLGGGRQGGEGKEEGNTNLKKTIILGSSCDFPVGKQNCPNSTDVTSPRFHAVLSFFRSDHRSAIRTHSERKFKARGRRRRSQHVDVCIRICMYVCVCLFMHNTNIS